MIGIGAAVTRRPLPHHRAYGSVHGDSSGCASRPQSVREGQASGSTHWRGPPALDRARAAGAMTRRTSGPVVKLNPRQLPLLRPCHRTLRLMHLELEALRNESRDALPYAVTRPLGANVDGTSSSGGELHPSALTEPDVKLSPHPAPTTQPAASCRAATGQRASGPAARCAPASASTRALGDETVCTSVAPMRRGTR